MQSLTEIFDLAQSNVKTIKKLLPQIKSRYFLIYAGPSHGQSGGAHQDKGAILKHKNKFDESWLIPNTEIYDSKNETFIWWIL